MYLLQILKTAVKATKSSLKPTTGIKSGNKSNGIIRYAKAAIKEIRTFVGVKGSIAISNTSNAGLAIDLPALIRILRIIFDSIVAVSYTHLTLPTTSAV